MSDAIFLLDEPPISDEPFPPGSYAHVKLVLDHRGRYPGELPDGGSTTHRLGVWHRARHRWIRGHTRGRQRRPHDVHRTVPAFVDVDRSTPCAASDVAHTCVA